MTKTTPASRMNMLYAPDESTAEALREIQNRREHPELYIKFGLPVIDKDFTPLGPGDILFWIARPGHVKTGNAVRWARYLSDRLFRYGMDDRVPVFVTVEDAISTIKMSMIAAQSGVSTTAMARGEVVDSELDTIKRRVVSPEWAVEDNVWFIGIGNKNREKPEPINVEVIVDVMRGMEKSVGKKPYAIFVDYLQLLSPEFGMEKESKVAQVNASIEALKRASLALACPLIVNAQAKAEVDKYNPPIPMMGDGQWSSLIAQAGQAVASSAMAIKYVRVGQEFDGRVVKSVSDTVITIWKQKQGPANIRNWVSFEPQYNRLNELEERIATLDTYGRSRDNDYDDIEF